MPDMTTTTAHHIDFYNRFTVAVEPRTSTSGAEYHAADIVVHRSTVPTAVRVLQIHTEGVTIIVDGTYSFQTKFATESTAVALEAAKALAEAIFNTCNALEA